MWVCVGDGAAVLECRAGEDDAPPPLPEELQPARASSVASDAPTVQVRVRAANRRAGGALRMASIMRPAASAPARRLISFEERALGILAR